MGEQRVVKLLYFGIAQVSEANGDCKRRTRSGTVVGTPHYFSPEQSLGMKLGPESDVYAFGLLAYEMTLGQAPFGGSDLIDVAAARVVALPPEPSSVWAEVPPLLNRLIMDLLARKPEKRPTLREVRDRLRLLVHLTQAPGDLPEIIDLAARLPSRHRAPSSQAYVRTERTRVLPFPAHRRSVRKSGGVRMALSFAIANLLLLVPAIRPQADIQRTVRLVMGAAESAISQVRAATNRLSQPRGAWPRLPPASDVEIFAQNGSESAAVAPHVATPCSVESVAMPSSVNVSSSPAPSGADGICTSPTDTDDRNVRFADPR